MGRGKTKFMPNNDKREMLFFVVSGKSLGGKVGPIALVYLASLWWASRVVQGTFQVWP